MYLTETELWKTYGDPVIKNPHIWGHFAGILSLVNGNEDLKATVNICKDLFLRQDFAE